mmetsp:Transcript_148072/g.258299  ORF Transcript_148072/g.258299 Transcript_148072/m.258299 type:complete len:130 (-) Transcript_148072:908-1297(-)
MRGSGRPGMLESSSCRAFAPDRFSQQRQSKCTITCKFSQQRPSKCIVLYSREFNRPNLKERALLQLLPILPRGSSSGRSHTVQRLIPNLPRLASGCQSWFAPLQSHIPAKELGLTPDQASCLQTTCATF